MYIKYDIFKRGTRVSLCGMQSDDNGRSSQLNRRTFLRTAAATGLGAIALSGTASAYHGRFETVVDVTDEGADNDGDESVSDTIEQLTDEHDNIALEFPPGRYLMDEQVFTAGFDRIGLFGDDATIVPVPADRYEGEPRLFKFGTSDYPGNRFEAHNFTVDFTEPNTGLRAIQTQVRDLWVENIFIKGKHDSGTWGPFQFDIVDSKETGLVKHVRAPRGGMYTAETNQDIWPAVAVGPTGIIVSPAHEGELVFEDCRIGPFPDNGLYSSGDQGTIHVDGGRYWNSNVANIRLAGNNSSIRNAAIRVDNNRPRDGNQVGIRLDEGWNMEVANTTVRCPESTGEAIKATEAVRSAAVHDTKITFADQDGTEDAFVVAPGAGNVWFRNGKITFWNGGQAIAIDPYYGEKHKPVFVDNVEILGHADGYRGGRHAIRVDRDKCEILNMDVDQPGQGYRRALAVSADRCRIAGGTYRSTHHPIVNDGSGTMFGYLEANAYNDAEAIKFLDGNANVDVHHCTLYDGYVDLGTHNLDLWENEYPDG